MHSTFSQNFVAAGQSLVCVHSCATVDDVVDPPVPEVCEVDDVVPIPPPPLLVEWLPAPPPVEDAPSMGPASRKQPEMRSVHKDAQPTTGRSKAMVCTLPKNAAARRTTPCDLLNLFLSETPVDRI